MTTQNVPATVPTTSPRPPEVRRAMLKRDSAWRRNRFAHLPGQNGLPVLGDTLYFLRHQVTWAREMYERFGPVYYSNAFGFRSVNVASAEIAHMLLRDKQRQFSSELGWDFMIGPFFARGLMLRDHDDHRIHRRIMTNAFRKSALRNYLEMMSPIIAEQVAQWPTDKQIPFYPAIKQLTLDVAGVVFTGFEKGRDLQRMNRAFVALMTALFKPTRWNIPGTAWWKGQRARKYLEQLFMSLIPDKRDSDDNDLLAQLCRAESEEGEKLTDKEVVDHIIFLMLAAHDTTTSALTNIVWSIGQATEWQDKLRDHYQAIGHANLEWDDLDALGDVDLVLAEALRMYPPVTSIPRYTTRDLELEGHAIPEGSVMWIQVSLIHRLEKYWSDPDTFDPMRFSEERAEHKRVPGQYVPYSAGAHICLGKLFSSIQVKSVLNQLLTRYRIELPPNYAPARQVVPFPKPTDDVPVTFRAV